MHEIAADAGNWPTALLGADAPALDKRTRAELYEPVLLYIASRGGELLPLGKARGGFDMRIGRGAVHVRLGAVTKDELRSFVLLGALVFGGGVDVKALSGAALLALHERIRLLKTETGERSIADAVALLRQAAARAITEHLRSHPCRHPAEGCRFEQTGTCPHRRGAGRCSRAVARGPGRALARRRRTSRLSSISRSDARSGPGPWLDGGDVLYAAAAPTGSRGQAIVGRGTTVWADLGQRALSTMVSEHERCHSELNLKTSFGALLLSAAAWAAQVPARTEGGDEPASMLSDLLGRCRTTHETYATSLGVWRTSRDPERGARAIPGLPRVPRTGPRPCLRARRRNAPGIASRDGGV